MRIADHFKKAVGLWPPKAPYLLLRQCLSGRGDVTPLPALLKAYPDAVRWEKKGDMQPLRYALWQRNLAACEILLEHDHSLLRDANADGATIVHEYAAKGEAKALQFLVHQGGDVNLPDRGGRTPLHHAALSRYYGENVALLLRYGAQSDVKDADKRTPLMMALMTGNKIGADALIKKPFDPLQTDAYQRTLLMAAAETGMEHLIAPLLKAGAPLDALNPLGETALDLAIKKKHGRAALQLMQAGMPAAFNHKWRKKLGNLIRPLEGSEAALRSIGLRPSPKQKATYGGPKPY